MRCIGIDNNTHDIYQASNGVWTSVWPATPILSVAVFIASSKESPAFDRDLTNAKIVFREDSFDPITRIRRGRFYNSSADPRPAQQFVLPHPLYGTHGSMISLKDGRCERMLYIFDQAQNDPPTKTVIIGSDESRWRVLSTERIVSGEYLVTLKARHALGILLELNAEAIPEVGREKAIETYNILVDSAYRETPGSIIDRARDAAQWFLGTWYAEKKNGDDKCLQIDLANIITKIENEKPPQKIIVCAATIIARLHSRGKPNEQEKRSTRPLMEADAEFALAAVGMLLREFNWIKKDYG